MVLTLEFTLAGSLFTALNGGPHYRFLALAPADGPDLRPAP